MIDILQVVVVVVVVVARLEIIAQLLRPADNANEQPLTSTVVATD